MVKLNKESLVENFWILQNIMDIAKYHMKTIFRYGNRNSIKV